MKCTCGGSVDEELGTHIHQQFFPPLWYLIYICKTYCCVNENLAQVVAAPTQSAICVSSEVHIHQQFPKQVDAALGEEQNCLPIPVTLPTGAIEGLLAMLSK